MTTQTVNPQPPAPSVATTRPSKKWPTMMATVLGILAMLGIGLGTAAASTISLFKTPVDISVEDLEGINQLDVGFSADGLTIIFTNTDRARLHSNETGTHQDWYVEREGNTLQVGTRGEGLPLLLRNGEDNEMTLEIPAAVVTDQFKTTVSAHLAALDIRGDMPVLDLDLNMSAARVDSTVRTFEATQINSALDANLSDNVFTTITATQSAAQVNFATDGSLEKVQVNATQSAIDLTAPDNGATAYEIQKDATGGNSSINNQLTTSFPENLDGESRPSTAIIVLELDQSAVSLAPNTTYQLKPNFKEWSIEFGVGPDISQDLEDDFEDDFDDDF